MAYDPPLAMQMLCCSTVKFFPGCCCGDCVTLSRVILMLTSLLTTVSYRGTVTINNCAVVVYLLRLGCEC